MRERKRERLTYHKPLCSLDTFLYEKYYLPSPDILKMNVIWRLFLNSLFSYVYIVYHIIISLIFTPRCNPFL